MNSFLKNRIKGIGIACKGAYLLVTTEASIKVEAGIAVLVTLAGIYVGLTPAEWMLQTLTIGLIISVEGLNTAVEKTVDFMHPQHNEKIGFIKDISAGAVFITALAGIAVGCIIYIPKCINML